MCQKKQGRGTRSKPQLLTIQNVLTVIKDRARYGDEVVVTNCSSLLDSEKSYEDLVGGWWHRDCYIKYASKIKLERARARYEESIRKGNILCRHVIWIAASNYSRIIFLMLLPFEIIHSTLFEYR